MLYVHAPPRYSQHRVTSRRRPGNKDRKSVNERRKTGKITVSSKERTYAAACGGAASTSPYRTRSQTSGIDPATRAAGWLGGRSPVSDDVTCVCTRSTFCTSRTLLLCLRYMPKYLYDDTNTYTNHLHLQYTMFYGVRCVRSYHTLHTLLYGSTTRPSYSRNLPITYPSLTHHKHSSTSVILSSSRRHSHSHRKCRQANLSLTNPQPRRQSRTRPGETTEQRVTAYFTEMVRLTADCGRT
jgi:hypothetical protein